MDWMNSIHRRNFLRKPKVEVKERCYKCGSYNLIIVRDSTWPSLVCSDCGAHVRDFGD